MCGVVQERSDRDGSLTAALIRIKLTLSDLSGCPRAGLRDRGLVAPPGSLRCCFIRGKRGCGTCEIKILTHDDLYHSNALAQHTP